MQKSEFQTTNAVATQMAEEYIGAPGYCLGSKSVYTYDNPRNLVVFNANVCTRFEKIWYGDIDLTVQLESMAALAKRLGETIFVLREMDARFENEKSPRLDRAVMTFSPDGRVIFDGGNYAEMYNGKPFVKPAEPYVPQHIDLNANDYEVIELPKLGTLRVTKKTDPLSKFQQYFIDKYGKEKATEIFDRLYVTSRYMDSLERLATRYAELVYPDLHPAKIEQSVSLYMFDMAPKSFETPQKWERRGKGYLKK